MDTTIKAWLALKQRKIKKESLATGRKLEDVHSLSVRPKKEKLVKVDCYTCAVNRDNLVAVKLVGREKSLKILIRRRRKRRRTQCPRTER